MYYSCAMIQKMALNIKDLNSDKALAFCCEAISTSPGISMTDNAEETLERFIGLRNMLLAQGIYTSDSHKFGCEGCSNYIKADWKTDMFISYVNLSMYPSPCQCKCCYCDVDKKWNDSEIVKKKYNKVFELLELGKRSGMINPNAIWQISTGEISIHPYRERIMELVDDSNAVFYTNAFIFDELIAQNLHNNPNSKINLSIDAGTSSTWKLVKGVDNFEKVTDNLVKYYSASNRANQISLKYIVLPGINDNYQDYKSVIEIIKVLKVPHLSVSRDITVKYSQENDNEKERLIMSAAFLVAMCHQNGISTDMFNYTLDEKKLINEAVKEIIDNELI